MRKLLFCLILIITIFFTGCNPMEIIKLERGALHFALPAAKRSLPTQDDVVLYRITVTSFEHGFEQKKEGLPGEVIIFDNLLPGNYNVIVLAFDKVDTLIFQGNAEGIEVIPGIIKQVVIQLNYSTGGIEISIIFPEETLPPTATPTPEPIQTLPPPPPIDLGDIDPEIIDCEIWHHLQLLLLPPFDALGLDVENNMWGIGDITHYQQCIYQVYMDSALPLGWAWNWPTETGNVKAYPEVIYGKKPWAAYSTVPGILPAQIQDISEIQVTYDIDTYVEGTCNLSFDIWVNSEEAAVEGNITHEVMIWLDNLGMDPISSGSPEEVTIDNKTYYYFSGYAAHSVGWMYHAFVIEETGGHDTINNLTDTINIHEFFNYLSVTNDYILNSDYISSIEFGNEICNGLGNTTINNYSVSVSTIDSTPEPTPIPEPTPTPFNHTEPGAIWFMPNIQTVAVFDAFTTEIHVNSGTQALAAYGIDIYYDFNIININTSIGSNGVVPGVDGFLSAVNPEYPGNLIIAGFDALGKGPGSNLHLITINWTAVSEGETELTMSINDLSDEYLKPIPSTTYIPFPDKGTVIVE